MTQTYRDQDLLSGWVEVLARLLASISRSICSMHHYFSVSYHRTRISLSSLQSLAFNLFVGHEMLNALVIFDVGISISIKACHQILESLG